MSQGAPESYRDAIEEGWRSLASLAPGPAAQRCGCRLGPGGVEVPLLGRIVVPDVRSRTVRDRASGEPVSLVEAVLTLHHLSFSDGTPLSGRAMSFREIPEGRFYDAVFHGRTVPPLVRAFGNDGGAFERSAAAAGGRPAEGSGLPFLFSVFPRVPVTVTYWPGEEEMPAGAAVTFDATAASHLPVEDIAVAGEWVVGRILARSGTSDHATLYDYE